MTPSLRRNTWNAAKENVGRKYCFRPCGQGLSPLLLICPRGLNSRERVTCDAMLWDVSGLRVIPCSETRGSLYNPLVLYPTPDQSPFQTGFWRTQTRLLCSRGNEVTDPFKLSGDHNQRLTSHLKILLKPTVSHNGCWWNLVPMLVSTWLESSIHHLHWSALETDGCSGREGLIASAQCGFWKHHWHCVILNLCARACVSVFSHRLAEKSRSFLTVVSIITFNWIPLT